MVDGIRGTWERFAIREERGDNHALVRTSPHRCARHLRTLLFARPLRPIQDSKVRVCLRSEIGGRG